MVLAEYEVEFNLKPTLWLRFIDNIFFVLTGYEISLKHFLSLFNNSYASYKKIIRICDLRIFTQQNQ